MVFFIVIFVFIFFYVFPFLDQTYVASEETCSQSAHPRILTSSKVLDGYFTACDKQVNDYLFIEMNTSFNECGTKDAPCATFTQIIDIMKSSSSSSEYYDIFLKGNSYNDSGIEISSYFELNIQKYSSSSVNQLRYLSRKNGGKEMFENEGRKSNGGSSNKNSRKSNNNNSKVLNGAEDNDEDTIAFFTLRNGGYFHLLNFTINFDGDFEGPFLRVEGMFIYRSEGDEVGK
jgi:hypothetical protein